MKKRRWIVIAAVGALLAAAAVTVGVYAYLESRVEKPNKFIIREDKVAVTETFPEPTYMSMQNSFTKQVAVENTGSSDQFVRVYLDFSDSTVRDQSRMLYNGLTGDDAENGVTWAAFLNAFSDPDNPVNGWVYVSDVPAASETPEQAAERETLGGYFYYTKVLKAGETTEKLIEGLKTDFRLSSTDTDANPDKITDFDIIVYTESVQTVETGTGKVYADADWKIAWQSFLTRTP